MFGTHWSGHDLPRPPGGTFLGGDLGVLTSRERSRAALDWVRRERPDLVELRLGTRRVTLVPSVRIASELCDASRFTKALAPGMAELRQYAGDGLFTAYSDEPNWQLAHDILMPAFSRRAMEGYHAIMERAVGQLCDRWADADEMVDATHDAAKLTLDTIGRAAFGYDFGSFESDERHPLVAALLRALYTAGQKTKLGSVPGGRVLGPWYDWRNRHHQRYADDLLNELIGGRAADAGAPGNGDILDLMLSTRHPETGESLSHRNIRYQILTFLVAGYETTASAISFALYYLSQHDDVRRRVRAEVDAEMAGTDVLRFDQVPRLRYLRRVLDESLRLWPAAPTMARAPLADTVIGGRYRMRTSDSAVVVLPLTHRDPEAWGDDADAFDPDRFVPDRARGRMPHSYKPFGTGERACIGRQFALHETVLALAHIVHRFDLQPEPGYELDITTRMSLAPRRLRIGMDPRVPATAV
ncbi:cytochrome P450 [Tsukamurella sp. 8F]|uniref:cytochrome P450 n=1 Tax=unclassified Tsukamurella TaxID=2633480 RepID=UPI0023B91821|nr:MULTISPECIES: cytochrome P450 [unclassified Tsukamurella]MDF0528642.1 cytochrome P450 [Tsukamurella sp. 8J]MDF0585604.1 cytochrome P450 [Tsukamurella sp. 8F]